MSATTLQPIEAPAGNGALALIRQAMASDVDPAKLRELLAVREQWEASEARKAFSAAISDFQRDCPIIEKADKAHNKNYARMDRIWSTVRPLLTGLGLSVTWQVCEMRDGLCHLEGQLRHRDGHSERLAMDLPMPDLVSGQNKAQQMGSARTYSQRYATCAALGIVTGDDLDDDGHKAGAAFVSAEQALQLSDKLDAIRGLPEFNEKAFWAWVGCGATKVAEIPALRFGDVLSFCNRKLKGGVA